MKLHEYEAKELFSKYGVKIPPGRVATTPEEVRKIAEEIGGPVVLKAQVVVAGRGKAGGIKVAKTPEEAYELATKMFGMNIKGLVVKKIYVTKYVEVEREMYLSLIIDRATRRYLFLASPIGGVDIEEIAKTQPEKIKRVYVDPSVGLRDYHVRSIVLWLGFKPETPQWRQASSIVQAMYNIMVDYDAELVESNPLAVTREGDVIPLDARVIVDDNALYKHPELEKALEEDPRDVSEFEMYAKKIGFHYVELDGDVGIIGNGAGLTMATMDLVYHFGGRPANFLDIGGGASRDVVKEALKVLLRHPRVKVIFMNIFGGITRADEVAAGVEAALAEEGGTKKKIVVRMKGTNEELGRQMLAKLGIPLYENAEEAAQKAVELARA
ncbi:MULTISPECIES: ADP-forming succinate--CoA ligase subunit beta [Pyrobaculum]|uniref:Succinate--CoA ligase [ADP-forming] subunit beta n=2 Tax=Pyrobaculum arsenaticum TaxID=121277 RepID=SUCC_PYRAR|nr:ADP-forming succinate--CoA ligase subunit beta [Pyrobaculum arsenaticum]A4WL16.1 RecName: Full=Succinate--CoA ligase [ADP-forming] subunit beta; AltName: Full=Succinyl-CoA synthetase subunit beta; Short=SCS-beta [Pyrobaculum arsenaticum DSM 13514]ABP51083.1 succinyl-CoA synthetase (ADP-forming) beta subunit [Pyrobaculum arsenaticum DSM 13514]MCY0891679.1 ADP-forming succinate--CoA ligase subunit beta [Pyrobaculum arsenaticum]NYR15192.1 ADP-forming succinate--CoA ligase subunit beta [Pyrobacu